MRPLPRIAPAMGFDEACAAVLDYLHDAVPLGLWTVTRQDGADQVALSVADHVYGLAPGTTVPWEDSLCRRMVAGGPRVNPDAMAVPAYAAAPNAALFPVGTYVGMPLERADGQLFGTLCGFDPERAADPAALLAQEPLLALLATLLSTVLEADTQRTEALRAAERAELVADSDALTGLLNRRGWDRYLALEEDRYRRFGDPGSVIIVDLDRLKDVNDAHGHAAGDDHLRRAADTLTATARSSDVLARLGGDEFGVVATRTGPRETAALVDRLQRALEDAGVSGSFGHAPYTIVSGFPGAWQAADQAMYTQKAQRRNSRQAG